MNTEVELARIAMWSDLIKVGGSTAVEALKLLGPAALTGLFGYLAGRVDFKNKLLNLRSQQEFSAREILLSLKKDRFKRILMNAENFQKTSWEFFGQYLGRHLAGEPLPIEMAVQYLSVVVPGILEDIDFVETEFKDTSFYKKEEQNIKEIREALEAYVQPTDVDGVLQNIKQLSSHFSILTSVTRDSLEHDMRDMFDKYLV